MDMLSKKSSTPDKKVVEKEEYYEECFFIEDGATIEGCHEFTLDPEKSKKCADFECMCTWRYCRVCVKHGTISNDSGIVNQKKYPNIPLCSVHLDKGEDYVIGSEEAKEKAKVVLRLPINAFKKAARKAARIAIIEAVVKKRRET